MNTELNQLYDDLEIAKNASEEVVCDTFNVDCRQDAIQAIEDEIKALEDEAEEYDNWSDYDELERERTDLCMSLGISRYC